MIVVDSDFSALEGTNCYCSEESAAQIRQAISGLPLCAVHKIGTGDYHYITLFWLERIEEPFTLVLFDNHPDDQPTAFSPDTLSCGSWVSESRKLPHCVNSIWINTPENTWGREPVAALPGVYISIDLDVLSREYARTDWDQGTMTLDELIEAIEEIKKSSRIFGVDICGGLTPQKGATDDDLALNARTEEAIIRLFREENNVEK